jgi:hypothetical protein
VSLKRKLFFIGGTKVSVPIPNLKSSVSIPLISVVIVTKDRLKDTTECIQSVFSSKSVKIEVILVDNGSTDNTVQIIGKKFPNVHIISNNQNLGLAEGRNLGQRIAKGDFILFLDSDTLIESNMVYELALMLILDKRIAFSSPKMYSSFEPKRVWYAGAFFSLVSGKALNFGGLNIDNGQFDQILTTSHAPTSFLVRKDIANKLGGHDNIFMMSYADSDFCIRMWKAGFFGVYVPNAILYHKVHRFSQSDSLRSMGMNKPLRAYYYARNKVIFMKRHSSKIGFVAFLLLFFPIYHIFYTQRILKNNDSHAYLSFYWKGVIDGIKYAFFSRLLGNGPR